MEINYKSFYTYINGGIDMNNWVEITIFVLCILLVHLIGLSTQALSGKQYFYGVYVKNIEIDDSIKKELHKEYKKRLNLSFLLVIVMFIAFGVVIDINPGLNIAIFSLVYVGLMTLCLKKSYDDVKLIKNNYLLNHVEENIKKDITKKPLIIDTELLDAKAKIKKKFTVLYGICIGLSILSLLYVAINYSSMPDVIITHWGGSGKPDGFSDKTFLNVFFTNFIDLSMVVLLSYLGVGMIGLKTHIDSNNLEVNRKKAIKYLNGMGYSYLLLILSMQSMTTTIPIFMVRQSNIPVSIIIFGCIIPIFVSVVFGYYYIMLRSLKPINKNSYNCENDDDKWIYGFIYYNKDDPSLMVDKRFGLGGSINFGNPKGMLIGIVLLVITVGSLLLPFIIK